MWRGLQTEIAPLVREPACSTMFVKALMLRDRQNTLVLLALSDTVVVEFGRGSGVYALKKFAPSGLGLPAQVEGRLSCPWCLSSSAPRNRQ
jgi:hypothetical protein